MRGLIQTFNAWQVASPGFFGTGPVTLTAYAVAGTAPALITNPGANAISNVARVNFTVPLELPDPMAAALAAATRLPIARNTRHKVWPRNET